MNIQQEITRLQAARNKIRNKLTGLGLAASTDKLDALANTIDSIADNGGVDVEVKEGETYKIPRGYHNGSGTVSGVAGGGNYTLQSKSIVPTKDQQNITPDAGKYGLSSVTVEAIPETYQDVTAVDAVAADVLANKKIVAADGTIVAGTMPNIGANRGMLTPTSAVHQIPKGYHNGTGTVGVYAEEKEFTPTKETQIHTATTKFVSKVTINSIPDAYQDVTEVDATADKVLTGSKFVDAEGNVVEGTMPNIGFFEEHIDTDVTEIAIPEGWHDGTGYIYIIPEEKSATPTKSAQTITPTDGKVLSKVIVAAIPDAYQDVTKVDATADKVLTGSKFVDAEGNVIDGTIPYIDMRETLDVNKTIIDLEEGYYDGRGAVCIELEEKPATPTKSEQTIIPTAGKVLSKVTVAAIPATYQDITVTTADADHVLDGKFFVNKVGVKTEGTMPNNGDVSASMDGLTVTSVTIPAGYTTGGTISLTDDIERELAEI